MGFTESKSSVYEHAKRAIDLVIESRMGRKENGGHGLPLIGKGDWNDGLDRVGHLGKGESVWLAFFLYDVLEKFAAVAEGRRDLDTATKYRREAALLRKNIHEHTWNGNYFIRAYADSGEKIDFNDAIVQAWAVLSGAADGDKASRAVASAVESLYKKDDKMILLFDRVLDKEPWGGALAAYPNGLRENNAQYTHGSSWLPRAVAELKDGDLAMELYKALLPTVHASDPRYGAEPYVVAADIYGGEKAGEGGWTWYSGGPGWIYRTGVEKILGIQFRQGNKLFIDPCIPKSWPSYQVEYARGRALYALTVENPEGVSAGVKAIFLDGAEIEAQGGILLVDDAREHRIRVILGRRSG
jgi:cyclic beta-1,2-glucan synthetase